VNANDRFKEFDREEDKPSAYNIELAYFPTPVLEFSVRIEGSDEFATQPHEQYGVSIPGEC